MRNTAYNINTTSLTLGQFSFRLKTAMFYV